MSIRFVIRKFSRDDYHRWSLRDGLCPNAEHHDFNSPYWTEDCTGACDTFRYFSSAIGTASEAK